LWLGKFVCRSGDVTPLEDDDGEEGVRQLTLDEWKALQTGSRPRTTFNVRKPGEGCTSDPTWKKMEMLRKKHDEVEVDQSGQFDDAVSLLCDENTQLLTVGATKRCCSRTSASDCCDVNKRSK